MDATFFATLIVLTAAAALITWRKNPVLAGRPALRLNLLSAIGIATLASLAVYVVALTVDRSPMTLGVTAAEAVVVGIAALATLRVRASKSGNQRRRTARPSTRPSGPRDAQA